MSSLALPAFWASAAGTLSVHSLILGPTWNGEDASFDCAKADWLRITGIEDPATCPGHKQSLWDKPLLLSGVARVGVTRGGNRRTPKKHFLDLFIMKKNCNF